MIASEAAWTGLTNGEMRALARKLCFAISKVDRLEALPDVDEWLNARIREQGCPENQLGVWRAKIKALPLKSIADVAA
jgi:hypothetical protein